MVAQADRDGLAALQRKLAALPAALRAAIATTLDEVATEVIVEARRALARSGPSRPGEAPADPTGALAASLDHSVDAEASTATLSAASPHAAFLEFGTQRMAARPFLRPAVEASRDAARTKLHDAVARAIAETLEEPS